MFLNQVVTSLDKCQLMYNSLVQPMRELFKLEIYVIQMYLLYSTG